MAKVRSTGSKIEERVFTEVLSNNLPIFIKNDKSIKGKPDLAFHDQKICVFIDSDFWHGWQYPRWKQLLKNDFWREKIEKNRKRDKNTTQYLQRHGWTVIRIWEHSLNKDFSKEITRIKSAFMTKDSNT